MKFLAGALFGTIVGAALGFLVGAYSFVPGTHLDRDTEQPEGV